VHVHGLGATPRAHHSGFVASAIRHPDVVEYPCQAEVVEINRRVEHRRVPGLQMVGDDECLGRPRSASS
jgi:hypothetical protein